MTWYPGKHAELPKLAMMSLYWSFSEAVRQIWNSKCGFKADDVPTTGVLYIVVHSGANGIPFWMAGNWPFF